MASPNLNKQITAVFLTEDGLKRHHALCELAALRGVRAMEAFDAIVALLDHSKVKIRRRAGSALVKFPRQVARRMDMVIKHLRQNSNPWVRLSCAISLMKIRAPAVTKGYRHALDDSSEKVVQVACWQLGCRGGAENTRLLRRTLNHSSWHIRLAACKALIVQGMADRRVVETLEAMSRGPEAGIYDAECDDAQKTIGIIQKSDKIPHFETWGTLSTILDQARRQSDPD